MAKVRSWVGLDVHARSVLAVTIDGESGEQRTRRLSGTTSEVVEFCGSLSGPTRVAYEAGPTGYGLARALELAGVGCVVAAPGKIERPSADRVKTDQRDAERVLRLLMILGIWPSLMAFDNARTRIRTHTDNCGPPPRHPTAHRARRSRRDGPPGERRETNPGDPTAPTTARSQANFATAPRLPGGRGMRELRGRSDRCQRAC